MPPLIQFYHLDETDLGYWGHAFFGLRMTALLFACSVVSLVHAITAVVFPYWGERMVDHMVSVVAGRVAQRRDARS